MATPRPKEMHGTGIPIKGLREDARSLSPVEFEDRHGPGFLLLSAADLNQPTGPMSTEVNIVGIDEPAERTASLSLVVYPLRRTERSVGHLVTIGRTANNDVVINDISISRFHAFAKQDGGGKMQIQDASSTNGTGVNGIPVASKGHGPASELKAGDSIRLGQVEFTFLDAKALQDFVGETNR
jgi:pSer/pThr/pTyr-binding forkhead associated (FHA) protein